MRVIAVTNQKGGVGKTTVALNLAACLGLAGRRVVLVDLDPQGNVAQGLGLAPVGVGEYPLSDALLHGEPLAAALRATKLPGLEVAPSDGVMMETTEARLSERLDGLEALGGALADLARDHAVPLPCLPHDYAVIDCRPSLGALTLGAIHAADLVIAPVEAGRYALEGLANLLAAARRLADQQAAPANVRLLVNRYQVGRVVSAWMDKGLAQAGAPLLATRIRQNEPLNQAAIMQQPVAIFAPRSAGAVDFKALAAEVEALWA